MTSTSQKLADLQGSGGALIGYFPLGYPTVRESVDAMVAMAEAGVDILEVGIPYSDPVMDGVVIQKATETALSNGFRLSDADAAIREIVASTQIPVLVMTYWNPVLQYGVKRFAEMLSNSGAAGAITPDLIPDEAADWIAETDRLGLDRVFLATPSSSDERIRQAAVASKGFVYAVSTMGITGAREDLDAKAKEVVSRIKKSSQSALAAVGIGISSSEQVAEVNSYADGAIVGSAFINAYQQSGINGLRQTVRALATGKKKN